MSNRVIRSGANLRTSKITYRLVVHFLILFVIEFFITSLSLQLASSDLSHADRWSVALNNKIYLAASFEFFSPIQ